MKKLRIFALCIGLSAVITFLFYLMTGYSQAVWFTEPNAIIRNAEIFLGLFTIPVLSKMFYEELTK